MPARVKIASFNDFSSGLSLQTSDFADLENGLAKSFGLKAAAAANNVVMTENSLEKFQGYDNYLASAISGTPVITGLYEYKRTGSGAGTFFIVCAGTKVYTASGGSLTEIYSGITAGEYFNFYTFNNDCIMLNGSECLYYDGTTCDEITFNDPDTILGTAKPKFAAIFRNRIYYSGDATNPSTVWTPQPGTYDDFDNTLSTVDAFIVSKGDGQKMMALMPLSKDLLVMYKQGSIHRLSGTNPFGSSTDVHRIEEISRDVGCIASRSVVQVGRDQFFFSTDGLKRLSIVNDYGDVVAADPSYEIQDDINALNFTEEYIEQAFAVYYKPEKHLYLHVPVGSGTTNTQVYVHDVVTGANMPRSGLTASCGAIVNRKYYTGSYDGQIYEQLRGDNYADAAISSSWESKWLAVGGLRNKKEFRHLMIYFETAGSASITVQWQIMQMDGAVKTYAKTSESPSVEGWDVGLWDQAVWDSGSDTIFKKNRLGRGLAIKLRIVNNNANERWKVSRIELGYVPLGRVGA